MKGSAFSAIVRVFVLAAFLITAVQSSAFAAEWKIDVANYSGKTINYLYCKRSDSTDWGKDILRSDQVLKHGESITINFGENPAEYYDLRAVWAESPKIGKGKDNWWGGFQVRRVAIVRIGMDLTVNYVYRD